MEIYMIRGEQQFLFLNYKILISLQWNIGLVGFIVNG